MMKGDKIVRNEVGADIVFPERFSSNGDNTQFGGGGNGGGGMNDQLEQRVSKLEATVSAIKTDLGILSERSVNFATRLDCQEIKTELAAFNSTSGNLVTKADIATLTANVGQCATKTELHKAINSQTLWLAGALVAIAGLTLTIATYIFK
ncbi:hypothetical protein [Pantoea agglomerans]|uniref:hypothetical protein n=1 Tax=Enterobacter agglomerans TaxID=549 RepID=UPI002413C63F|nr:hypothetical protein [Pantoea agglomerans]